MNIVKEKVISIIDGDTFKTDNRIVRLANVNAPEKDTPSALQATRELAHLILGKTVSIGIVSQSYGRDVAHVTFAGKSVNDAMNRYLKNDTSQ